MLISDIVRRNAAFYGDWGAVVVPGQRSSNWTEMDERSSRLARAFLSIGMVKGDRVATFMPNCAEYIDFFFACAKTGVIGATTNTRLTGDDLKKYLSLIEPSAILVHAEMRGDATWVSEVPSIKHVIGVGEGHGFELDLEELLAAEEPTDPGCTVSDDDTYQIAATSGTTGTPKGALLSHRNAVAAILSWMSELPIRQRGTNFQSIPFFFNPGGPAGLHPVMMKGGRSIIFPGFDAGTFLRSVPEYQVTHTILVPTMVTMVLGHPECGSHDMSTLVGIMSGGSPLPRAVLVKARELIGDVFYPLYGMAETYSSGMILRQEDQFTEGTPEQVRRLSSAGKPNVLMQVRVVDENGSDVPRDGATPGEIWMRGDTVSPGYFRMPEETGISREGPWLKSGDLATIDSESFVTIVDRSKDIIISGGINVFSRDVEDALYAHPAVAQAAAIGIPHERWGEAVHAVIALVPGAKTTVAELLAFAAERLADYKKPRSAVIVDSLPVGGTGKILKRELRDPYWEGRDGAV